MFCPDDLQKINPYMRVLLIGQRLLCSGLIKKQTIKFGNYILNTFLPDYICLNYSHNSL